ncbi:COG2-domain-containing protein [Testicularia cyperi]|uniref:Conserved oligomeric Golgi complex subunit 2 n=1 Tax=Testicularia cyperi TaxID=1882483 RepID=A0A317XMX5_9BASI|nr:COG2-domain-containing protein [Testicularia cyperi]
MAEPQAESTRPHQSDHSLPDSTAPFDYNAEGPITEFPSLAPLSHDLELLSPLHAPVFDVDNFLLSRTKASDLNYILSDLRSYSEKLKEELFSIINEDYRDFVSLGSSLKSESYRIARLGWGTKQDGADVKTALGSGMMAPVRDTLIASRDTLKSVELDIRSCMQRREEVGNHKARLELMLQLHDSIVRLEDLLHVSSTSARRQSSTISLQAGRQTKSVSHDESSALAISDSDPELSDYALSSDDDDSEDATMGLSVNAEHQTTSHGTLGSTVTLAAPPSGVPAARQESGRRRRRRRKMFRRASHGLPSTELARQYSDVDASTGTSPGHIGRRMSEVVASHAAALSGLPQRIARTSAEYSRLRFLSRRVQEEGLNAFAHAVHGRTEHVRSVLREELRTLLAHLVAPTSLLVHGQAFPSAPSSPELRRPPMSPLARRTSFLQGTKPTIRPERMSSDLDRWSQVAEPIDDSSEAEALYWEARFEEQRSWLEMVLGTLDSLDLGRSDGVTEDHTSGLRRRNEAEEAVRELMVQDWTSKNISVSTAKEAASSQAGFSASENAGAGLPASALMQFADSSRRTDAVLIVDNTGDELVTLYNKILRYLAHTAWQISQAASQLTSANIPQAAVQLDATEGEVKSTRARASCDIFVNVLWDEISARLLEDVGSTIFFVGRTETFYKNFTNTNLFLQRLASLAPSPKSEMALREHPSWMAFKRRWQLPVYFQMRFREVISRLEDAYLNGRVFESAKDSDTNHMKATISTLEAIRTLWSEGVHIHELSAREWRVTLQILSRFKTWIEEQTGFDASSTSGPLLSSTTAANRLLDGVKASGPGSDGSKRSMDRAGSTEISRVNTPQPPADQPTQQQEDSHLLLLSSLVADCLYLQSEIDLILDQLILPRICSNLDDNGEAGQASSTALRGDLAKLLAEESFSFLPGLISAVGRNVLQSLLPRCVEPLRMLRSFTAPSYRATSTSGSPTVQVIHQIFGPIESFLRLVQNMDLPKDMKRSWLQTLLVETFRRYSSTVETINKNQQSLNRLKKSQNSSGGGLLGFFKSSTNSGADQDSTGSTPSKASAVKDPNQEAIETFAAKIEALGLDFDLDDFAAWTQLKSFLESQSEEA